MRPRTRTRHLVGALVAVAATAAVSLASPAVSYAAGTPSASSGTDAGQPSQAQWEEFDKISKKHHALGVFGDSAPVISLPADTPAGEKAKAVAEIPAGAKVTVKVSRFTQKQLNEIEKDIATGPWKKGVAKDYSIGVSYDGVTDKTIVDTDAPASVIPALADAFGDKIQVRRARLLSQYGRYSDYAPFFGGSSLISEGSGLCSSGFALANVEDRDTHQRVDMMTTAGHCYKLNALVKNRHWDWSTGDWEGWIKQYDWNMDVQAMTGFQYGNRIWTGNEAFSGDSRQVKGTSGLWDGIRVCVSGQTTLQHCNHPLSNPNYGFSWKAADGSDHYSFQQDGFSYAPGNNWPAYDQGPRTQGGDSGAPIYTTDTNGGAYAVGTHSGISEWYDGQACGCWNARMNGIKIDSILNRWGARLKTW